jgi:hypothetical protein
VILDVASKIVHSPEKVGLSLGHRPRLLREFCGFRTKCCQPLLTACVVFHDGYLG